MIPRPDSLQPPADLAVVPFFFERYLLASLDPTLTSRGHFDCLMELYSKDSPSSPLALAVFATAARAMASHLSLGQNNPFHIHNEMAASQAIMKAITDPEESLRDEILLAVLCLEFGTHFSQAGVLAPPSRAHLDGALALIQHRGARNYVTPASQSLFAATRSNILLQALWYDDERSAEAVSSFPDVEIGVTNPITKLHYILLKVLKFDSSILADIQSENMEDRRCRRKFWLEIGQELMTYLDTWLFSLPWSWRIIADIATYPDRWPAPDMVDGIPFLHVADVLIQWQCIRLMIVKSFFHVTQWESAMEEDKAASYASLRSEAQTIAETTCRLLTYLETQFGQLSTQEGLFAVNSSYVTRGNSVADSACILSLNLSGWMLSNFEERLPGIDALEVSSGIMAELQHKHERALGILKTIWPSDEQLLFYSQAEILL